MLRPPVAHPSASPAECHCDPHHSLIEALSGRNAIIISLLLKPLFSSTCPRVSSIPSCFGSDWPYHSPLVACSFGGHDAHSDKAAHATQTAMAGSIMVLVMNYIFLWTYS
eukprot:1136606-Pelagomonas_calceolata.AAC.5